MAVSFIGSPLASWSSPDERKIASPPSLWIAEVKETLVRVDGFSKIRATILPFNEVAGYPRFLNLVAILIISRMSSFFVSVNSRRCFILFGYLIVTWLDLFLFIAAW